MLAIYQADYKQTMIKAMKKSKVKEGILNLTKGNNIDKGNSFIQLLKEKIEVTYTKRNKSKTKEVTVASLLKKLSKDLNFYFPIVKHRKNVLEKKEDFWVAFNPPDHDTTEYFLRGYNQFGDERLFSSKAAPEENVAVLAYSENQEAYSPALIEAKYKCPIGETCEPYDPPPYDPPTVEMAKGLNITKFKTVGWHDGAGFFSPF